MTDSYKETTRESWGSRMMESIKGVLTGLILFLGAFAVLFWNEGRAVKRAKALEEGNSTVQTIGADEVLATNDGKLVHLMGKATTTDTLVDHEFGITFHGIRLSREVEMYQWKEKKSSKKEKKLGGAEETVTKYDYKKGWSSSPIKSSGFKKKEGHTNPERWAYSAKKYFADHVSLGAFTLPGSLVGGINKSEPLLIEKIDTAYVANANIISGKIYLGSGNTSKPEIGDMRIGFTKVGETNISIVAKQVGSSFEPFTAANGEEVELLELGSVSADRMFAKAQSSNQFTTWLLRFIGFLMMFGGLSMVFKPLVVFADVIPFLGSILSMGLSAFSGIISLTLSFTTIAIAWLVYRPIVGVGLILAGLVILGAVKYLADQKKKAIPNT